MLVRYCSYFKFDMLQRNSKINEMKKDTVINIDLKYPETHACTVALAGKSIGEMGLAERPEDSSARAEAIW